MSNLIYNQHLSDEFIENGWVKEYLYPRKIHTLSPVYPNDKVADTLLCTWKTWCETSFGKKGDDWYMWVVCIQYVYIF